MTFNEWYEKLKEHARSIDLEYYIVGSGKDSWKDFYDDDYTPQDALTKDLASM